MRVLGIDPGYATIGYGVIEQSGQKNLVKDYGVITTPKDDPMPRRLYQISQGIDRLMDVYEPDAVAVEELFFSKNVTTGIYVAHARGVILVSAYEKCGGNLFEYTPMQIKQGLTGYGGADKRQIQHMVKTLLGLPSIPRPDDAADALAVALCHLQTNRLGGLFRI